MEALPAYWRSARFVFLALAALSALGCYAAVGAPESIFPAIALARVEVFAEAGDLEPERMLDSVARPLENALATLPGVRAERAFADTGKLEIELDFDPRGDTGDDLRAVRAALADVRDRLPVTRVTTLIEGPDLEPVVTFAVRSGAGSQARLLDSLRGAATPVFTGVPGLGRIALFGGPHLAYRIELDPRRLAAAQLAPETVAGAVRAAARPRAAGTIARGRERFDVMTAAPPRDAAALGLVRVPLPGGRGSIALRDLGAVNAGEESSGTQASFDGAPAVLLNIYPEPGADAVALRRAVEARLPTLRAALPAGVAIDPAWDQTRVISAAQTSLRDEMLAGAILALLVIFIFLRDRTMVLVAALVVPATLVLTAFALVRAGLSLNVMTLGGLAIAVGLAIDEVIVVVEAIARELAARPGFEELSVSARRAAIGRAVARIARPLLAATAANVVVFIPLGFLSGVPGFFFRALSITLATALLVSTALSLTLVPMLAGTLRARTRAAPRLGAERAYVRLLQAAAARRPIVYAGAVLLGALTFVLFLRLPTDFLPAVDEGQFEIKYALPPGMTLAAADAAMRGVERAIAADPAVAHEARLSGVDTNGYVATPPDAGTIRVIARNGAAPFDALAARLRRAALRVEPDLYVEIHQLLEDQINDLSGAPEPIQISIRGPKQAVLETLADRIAGDIDDVDGLVDTFDGIVYQARVIDAAPLAPGSIDAADFAGGLRARVDGIDAGELPGPHGLLPVVVRVAGTAPLERYARLGAPRLTSEIQEENGVRLLRVTAGVENANLSSVVAQIAARTRYTLAHLPPGYSVELGGAVAAQRSAFREFTLVLAIAVLLVFAVLVLTFDSFRLPLVVLATVPLAPLGVAAALLLTNTPVNVASFMGMLLLVGIVVRNGILLVDGARRRRLEGTPADAALAEAAVERLRPIVMTTVATLGALAPLALGFGAGSELERPLAVAVLGGLVSATAFSLILVPALYAGVARARP